VAVLLTQHCPGDKTEKNEMSETCSAYGGEERCIQSLGGENWGKRPLGRPRRRWENYIKIDLHEVGCGEWGGGGFDRAG